MKNNSTCLAVVGAISFNVALVMIGFMFYRATQKHLAQLEETGRVIDENRLNAHLRETGQLN